MERDIRCTGVCRSLEEIVPFIIYSTGMDWIDEALASIIEMNEL